MPDVRSIVELVRAPAALSVPGDSLAGAAAAGWPLGAATPALGVASVCLYWAGMALNDYADRDVDAVERPQRPIPSGRVTPRFALGVAAGLTAAGVGVAGLVGGRGAVAVAAPLAATVWAYDLALKSTPVGPVAMGAARALDVLLGAGAGRLRPALPAALILGAHTVAITMLSRHEVTGGSRRLPAVTLAATAAVTAAAMRGTGRSRSHRIANAVLLAGYAGTFGRSQLGAVRDPSPAHLQRAVGAGILAMMPLQAALAAGAGALAAAVPVAAAFPLARRLARKVSPT